jgi:NAD(P)-dependent dehydrogenase (short-subunit alcohol dehydrogenase family)
MTPVGSVSGKVAAVTGAASGIGRALALELHRRGATVSGCDVDTIGLQETADLVPGMHVARVDVGDRDAVFAYAAEVCDRFGRVNQIYNNAGIAFGQAVLDSTWQDYERVLRVNLNGVIHGTQAFLPHVIASGDGHVVNVSSLNGYLAQPGMSHYCASKFAVRGFTECLALEMQEAKVPVGVTLVHPGGVRTSIADNALDLARAAGHTVTAVQEQRRQDYNTTLLRMEPAVAAKIIVAGVEDGSRRIRVGRDAVLTDLLVRLLPVQAGRIVLALDRRITGTDVAAGTTGT